MQHKAGNTPQPPNQSFNLHRLSFILEKNYISPVLRLRNVANLKQNVMSNSNEYQCRLTLDMQFEMLFSLNVLHILFSHREVYCCTSLVDVPDIHCCCQKSLKSINITVTAPWHSTDLTAAQWDVPFFCFNRKRRSMFWFAVWHLDRSLCVTLKELSQLYLRKLSCDKLSTESIE